MKSIIAGALMALAVTISANAAEEEKNSDSAEYALQNCKIDYLEEVAKTRPPASWSDVIKGRNLGYCLGVVEGIRTLNDVLQRQKAVWLKPEICFVYPSDAPNGLMLKVALDFTAKHPELAHRPFPLVALIAFIDAWPCDLHPRTAP